MRIAVVTWSGRRAGGAETYIASLPAALHARGHATALWHEVTGPANRPPIAWPDGPVWAGDLPALQAWKPDIIYAHGLLDPMVERQVLALAPTVLFAHGYYGTCVSGTKTFMTPTPAPCTRQFGTACLSHYYPRRCGGLNPLTMLREFSHQDARHALLGAYRAVATASEHMRREMERHGAREAVTVGLPAAPAQVSGEALKPLDLAASLRLVFAGRMDQTKGGDVLLAALPLVRERVARSLDVTLLGDGPMRARWERQAGALASRGISVRFAGWVDVMERQRVYAAADLLVVPSIWPEPFGLVGLEAAAFGIPAAAFAVGGIPEWLADGVNGHLAPGDAPRAAALAEAIARCVTDPAHHLALRRGALAATARFGMAAHLDRLLALLTRAAA